MKQQLKKFVMIFKAEAEDTKIYQFFKEWIDDGYLFLDGIQEGDIINEDTGEIVNDIPIKIARLASTEENYNWFQREFGNYITIREGWDGWSS